MTKNELKSLPNLKIASESATTLHIHTEDGYVLYNYTKEVYEHDGKTEVYCDLNGSNCYYFPIYEEYPKYELIDTTKYLEMKREFDEMKDEEKVKIVEKWLGE